MDPADAPAHRPRPNPARTPWQRGYAVGFLIGSLLFLAFVVATIVWAQRTQTGRERERYMLQGGILLLVALALTAAAISEL